MSLVNLITKFKGSKRVLFTTPSHNQGKVIAPKSEMLLGKKYFECDYSEIEDFDNLAAPEGAIKECLTKAADVYQSQASFYLQNGSTSGMLALMLTTLEEKDKVLIARNCHKSVYNGLVLTGAQPIWITPKFDKEWGIFKPISAIEVEDALKSNPDVKAFIMTNPTYEGLISNITRISEVCKKNNVLLIVDEAHGALWNFDKTIGIPSLLEGADATVQSLHKTAGAINPSAILHISKGSSIETEKVQSALNIINTTSPSYPLLANIEGTIDFLNSKQGKKEISKLVNSIYKFKQKLLKNDNIQIYYDNNDITKILIKVDELSGYELSDILFHVFNIEDELANEKSVMFLTGIGTRKTKLNKLLKALDRIAKDAKKGKFNFEHTGETKQTTIVEPKVVFTPKKAYKMGIRLVKQEDSIGLISQELIISYPPGMPSLIPGELIQEAHLPLFKDKEYVKVLLNK